MTRRRRSRREWIAFRLPVAVAEFPFETFVALYAMLAAAAVLLGGVVPDAMRAALPSGLITLWALSLGLGAATVGYGLFKQWLFPLAAGLRLVAFSLLVYLVAFIGLGLLQEDLVNVVPGAILLGSVITLAAVRSFYLRTVTILKHRLRREAGDE